MPPAIESLQDQGAEMPRLPSRAGFRAGRRCAVGEQRAIWGGLRLPLALLLLVCTVAGCGGTGDVSGKVTYKGKPVVSGAVLLMTSDQLPHYGQLQNDGSFSILGLPKGEARIAVNSPDPKALYAPASTKFGKKQSAPPLSLPEASKWFPLPAKVGDPHSSGLKLTVHGGVNVLNLELKDE